MGVRADCETESAKGRAWTRPFKNGHEFWPVGLCPTSWGPKLGTSQWRLEVPLPVWWWWSGFPCDRSGRSQHTLWLRVKERTKRKKIKMCLVLRPIDFVRMLNEVIRDPANTVNHRSLSLNWTKRALFSLKANTHFTVFVFPKSWTKQSFQN